MIIDIVNNYKQQRITSQPCNSNRASQLGHPCIRYLVLCRTKAMERRLHSLEMQYIFDEGEIHEKAVIRLLSDIGFNVIEQQTTYTWAKYQITGHIDCIIDLHGSLIPLEIKSMSPFIWDKINNINDMFNSKYLYLRQYPAQLTLYMLLTNHEQGIFLLKNKVNGKLKEIVVTLDYAYAESLIQKAERVNQYIINDELPDPIDNDICNNCGFVHLCGLTHIAKNEGLKIIDNQELLEDINRMNELKGFALEYEEINKRVKAQIEGVEGLIGNYLLSGKWVERKIPAKKEYVQKFWQSKIVNINNKKGENGDE